MSLHNIRFGDHALIVRVKGRVYGTTDTDEAMVATLVHEHGVQQRGCRVIKSLFPSMRTPFSIMEAEVARLQTWTRTILGFPTRNEGEYLVPQLGLPLFQQKFDETRERFEAAKASLTPECYEALQLMAMSRSNRTPLKLGGEVIPWAALATLHGCGVEELLFVNEMNPDGSPKELEYGGTYWIPSEKTALSLADYAPLDEAVEACSLEWQAFPIAEGHHFGDWANATIRGQVDELSARMVQDASKTVFNSMLVRVKAVADALLNPNAKITSSIEKLREMVDLAEIRNLARDPQIDQLAAEVKQALEGVSLENLRRSPDLRETVGEMMGTSGRRFLMMG